MNQRLDTKANGSAAQIGGDPVRRRKSILRSVLVLAVATIILFVFILVQGDIRRRQRNVDQAFWHAGTLAERAGETGVLPLNLEPVPTPGRQPGMFEWVDRDDARHLRNSDERVIAAYTVRPLQLLLRDGRAVIVFERGRFDVEWMTLSRFDELFAAQREDIRRIAAGAPRDRPGEP